MPPAARLPLGVGAPVGAERSKHGLGAAALASLVPPPRRQAASRDGEDGGGEKGTVHMGERGAKMCGYLVCVCVCVCVCVSVRAECVVCVCVCLCVCTQSEFFLRLPFLSFPCVSVKVQVNRCCVAVSMQRTPRLLRT